MQNVFRFPEAPSKSEGGSQPPQYKSDADVMAQACVQFEEAAKREIHRSLLLLDLAAQRARLFVKQIGDPSDRRNVETQIERLEIQIRTARELAAQI